jgi:hypothetical protein
MLKFTENGIHQSCPGIDKVWRIPELLEKHNPLPSELSEAAQLRMGYLVAMMLLGCLLLAGSIMCS